MHIATKNRFRRIIVHSQIAMSSINQLLLPDRSLDVRQLPALVEEWLVRAVEAEDYEPLAALRRSDPVLACWSLWSE